MTYKQKLILLFLLLAPMYQIAADIYIPSLPHIQKDLTTSVSNIQLSITLFLLGSTIAQIVYGNISEFIGPKNPMIFGLFLTFISSAVCATSSNILIFNIGKLCQGIGVASITLYRVILFSNFEKKYVKKIFSNLSAITIVALASAPLVGSFLHHTFNWPSTFIFMSLYSLLTLLYLIKITYSQQTSNISINHIKTNNLYVLKNKKFISYSLLILFSYFSIISWVSASAYILQKSYYLSTISCGYVLLYCGFIAAVANLINAKLNYQTNSVICFGICCILIAGLSLLLFNLTNTLSLLLLIFSISFLMFGIGFVFPNCFQIAMQTVPNKIGVANSIICTFQAIGGIISSFLYSQIKF